MNKIIFFLIFFLFSFNSFSANQNKSLEISKGCIYDISETYVADVDNSLIKLIEVDINDYRKWTINSVRILTHRYRYVPDKFKKRFDATITVTYGNKNKCIFDASVRHSGDEKDHIGQLQNSITQSLDIHLKNGNIRGITKFKLLRPKTRGVLEDEIFLTELLRNLNYLAPRTVKVISRVNNVTTNMIFQEKAVKELLEFNNRREGPILEGDEKNWFTVIRNIEDNNLSGWDMGVVELYNQSTKHLLTKQVNANIVQKSQGHKEMSLDAVANLNLIYLYYSNRFQDELNNYNYSDYDLDNRLLGAFDKRKVQKLNEYNLLILAANGQHGLAPNNRKFYWNSLEKYFEPLNYDSNANISIQPTLYRLPISKDFFEAFPSIRQKLEKLNLNKIVKKMNLSGLDMSLSEVEFKRNKMLKNLNQVEANYLNAPNELIEHNDLKMKKDIYNAFNTNLKKLHPETYLIKQKLNSEKFEKCKVFFENCTDVNFSTSDLSSLLEGDLKIKNASIKYVGRELNLKYLYDLTKYKKITLNNTSIFYESGVDLSINHLDKIIDINQNQSGSKIYLINGDLKDFKINYKGYNIDKNNSDKIPNDFPTNSTGLTGCLSFINMNLSGIEINAINSTCEDAVNLINVSGDINNINIKNSFSDGLDVDFSNLNIKNINIDLALNDCVDFSHGEYKIEKLHLSNCGDKALSVGEKSKLEMKEIVATKSKFGIASKDSSIVEVETAKFENLDTCLTAYKKKQEFEGGVIKLKKMSCNYLNKEIILDKYSVINLANKI